MRDTCLYAGLRGAYRNHDVNTLAWYTNAGVAASGISVV